MDRYVSVIIPTYNRENTIKRSIESVLNQTHKFLEVIIVDDNSDDNTKEKIDEIKDKRIRYIKLEKNSGANFARNVGIELASYELIAFQDSDDEWNRDKLEVQLKIMEEKKIDFIATSYNQYVKDKFNTIVPIYRIENNYLENILLSNFIGTVTLLVKKDILLKEKFNEKLPRYQDYELAIRLISKYRGFFLNLPTVNAYIQENSISKSLEKAIISLKKILVIHRKLYKKNSKILSLKYLEIYKITVLLKREDKKYLFLSLRKNKNIKNIIYLILYLTKLNNLYRIKESVNLK